MKVHTLWFDESAITVDGLKNLKKQGFKIKGHRDLVKTLRQQKDKQELANIRTAIRRAEEAFRELKADIQSGRHGTGTRDEARISDEGKRGPQDRL